MVRENIFTAEAASCRFVASHLHIVLYSGLYSKAWRMQCFVHIHEARSPRATAVTESTRYFSAARADERTGCSST